MLTIIQTTIHKFTKMQRRLFSLVLILLFFEGCGWNHLMSKAHHREDPLRYSSRRVEGRSLAISSVQVSDFDSGVQSVLPSNGESVSSDSLQSKHQSVSQPVVVKKEESVSAPVYRVLDDQGNVIYVF